MLKRIINPRRILLVFIVNCLCYSWALSLYNPYFYQFPENSNPEEFLKQINRTIVNNPSYLNSPIFLKKYDKACMGILPNKLKEIKEINARLKSIQSNSSGYFDHIDAVCLIFERKFDESIKLTDKKILEFKNDKELSLLFTTLKAAGYYFLNDYETSTNIYLTALKHFKLNKKEKNTIYQNVGSNFYSLRLNHKALEYYLKVDKYYNHKNIDIINYITWIYIDLKQFDKADFYANLLVKKQLKFDDFQKSNMFETLSKLEFHKGNFSKADILIDQSIKLITDIQTISGKAGADPSYFLIAKFAIKGDVLKSLKRYPEAVEIYTKALEYSISNDRMISAMELNKSLYSTYKLLGNSAKSLEHFEKFQQLESIENKNKVKSEIIKVERKYNFDKQKKNIFLLKKDKKIKQSEIEKDKNYILILIISILLVTTVLIGLTKIYLLSKNKNKLSIEYLKKESELQKTIALLNGQEIEKNRISKELHDGVANNILALIFSNPTEIKPKLKEIYEEIRIISHNLTGLNENDSTSLREIVLDLYFRIFDETAIKLDLDWDYSVNLNISNSDLKTTLYRVTQELFLNILKHSNASKVRIEFTIIDEMMNLTIYDDGAGVNSNTKKGIGLKNIEERINAFFGEFTISFNNTNWGSMATIKLPIN